MGGSQVQGQSKLENKFNVFLGSRVSSRPAWVTANLSQSENKKKGRNVACDDLLGLSETLYKHQNAGVSGLLLVTPILLWKRENTRMRFGCWW